MRYRAPLLLVLFATLLSACDYWPKELRPLAESIDEQVSGETVAWLVGSDVVVIMIGKSPLYERPAPELEPVAADLAAQAIRFVDVPLESVAVTFVEGDVHDEAEGEKEFLFLVTGDGPELIKDPPEPMKL